MEDREDSDDSGYESANSDIDENCPQKEGHTQSSNSSNRKTKSKDNKEQNKSRKQSLNEEKKIVANENQISKNTQRSIEYLSKEVLELIDDSKEYCHSLEKYLLSLTAIGIQREHQIQPTTEDQQKYFSDNSLNNNLEQLKIALEEEDLLQRYEKLVDGLELAAKNSQWGDFKNHLRILKEQSKVMTINLPLLKRLALKASENAQLVEGKDIVLLLGTTGSGKSTFIHFMAGSKMGYLVEDGIRYIGPVDVKNPQLKDIKVSPLSKSETLYISPVQIKDRMREITFVDGPGQDDNRGIEIDISNQFGISKALRAAKTVKPVILLNSNDQGARFDGVKRCTQQLVRLINNLERHYESLTFIFTKYNKDDEEILKNKLQSLYQLECNSGKQDHAGTKLIEYMAYIAQESGVKIFDPINDKSSDYLSIIRGAHPLDDPEEQFNYAIGEKTKSEVRSFISLQCKRALIHLKKGDFQFVNQKLMNFKQLQDLINLNDCTDFEDLMKDIKNHFQEIYKRTTDIFRNQIQLNSIENFTTNYLREVMEIQKFDVFINQNFQESKVVTSDAYILILKEEIQKLSEILKCDLSEFLKLQNTFEKMNQIKKEIVEKETIANHFPEIKNFISQILENALKNLEDKFKQLNLQLKEKLQKEQINEIKQLFSLAKLIDQSQLSMLVSRNLLEDFKIELNNILQEKYNLLKEKSQGDLEQESQNEIIKCLDFFNGIESDPYILECFDSQQGKYLDKSVHLLEDKFSDLVNKCISLFEKEYEQYQAQKCKEYFIVLERIKNIQIVQPKVIDSYYKILNKLIDYLNQIKVKGQQQFEKLREKRVDVDFSQLRRYLREMKEVEWINKLREGAFDYLQKNADNELEDYFHDLNNQYKRLDLDIDKFDDLNQIQQIVSSILGMREIQVHCPSIKSLLDGFEDNYKTQIGEICQTISKKLEFNFDKKLELNLQFAEKALNFLSKFNQMNRKLIPIPIAKELQYQIEEGVSKYYDLVIQQLEETFQQINNESMFMNKNSQITIEQILQKEEEQMDLKEITQQFQKYVRIILKNLQDLKKIELDTELIKKLLEEIKDNRDPFTLWKTKFEHLKNTEDSELTLKLQRKKDLYLIEVKLAKVQCLSQLDPLLRLDQSSSFLQLYNEKFQILQNILSRGIEDIGQSFDAKNFNQLNKQLMSLKGMMDDTQKYDNACEQLRKKFLDLYQNIDQASFLCQDELSKQSVERIVQDLRIFQEANKELGSYLDNQYKDQDILNRVEENLKIGIQSYNFKLVELNHQNKFKRAEEGQQKLQQLMRFICQQIPTIKDKIKFLEQEYDKTLTQILKLKIKYFIDTHYSQYQNITPNPLSFYNELDSCSISSQYKEAKNILEQEIKQMYQKQLNNLKQRKDKKFEEIELTLQEIEISIKFVSSLIKNEVSNQIQEIKAVIKKEKNQIKIVIADKLSRNTFFELRQEIQSNPILFQEERQYLEDEIQQKFSRTCNSCLQFFENISQHSDQDIDQEFNRLFEIVIFYGDLFQQTMSYYSVFEIQLIQKVVYKLNLLSDNLLFTNLTQIKNTDISFQLFKVILRISDKFTTIISHFQPQLEKMKTLDSQKVTKYFEKGKVKIQEKLNQVVELICSAYQKIQQLYSLNFQGKSMNKEEITELLEFTQKNDEILLGIRNDFEKEIISFNAQKLKLSSKQYQGFTLILRKVTDLYYSESVKIQSFKLINPDTDYKSPLKQRQRYFQEYQDSYLKIQQLQIPPFVNPKDDPMLQFKQNLRIQIQKIQEDIQTTLNEDELEDDELKEIENFVSVLETLESYFDKHFIEIINQSKQKIVKFFELKTKKISQQIIKSTDVIEVKDHLISLKKLSNGLSSQSDKIDQVIDSSVTQLIRNPQLGSKFQMKLGLELESNPIGQQLIQEHSQFNNYKTHMFNQKVQNQTLDYFLSNIEGGNIETIKYLFGVFSLDKKNGIEIEKLRKKYQEYKNKYDNIIENQGKLIKEGIREALKEERAFKIKDFIPDLRTQIFENRNLINWKSFTEIQKVWNSKVSNIVENLIPQVLAYWTLTNSTSYYTSLIENNNDESFLLSPHIGQVLAILRAFCLEDGKYNIQNQALQIGTGEGKSVILATISTIFALIGFNVDVACYSSYLSQRDSLVFKEMFDDLEVSDFITYGTFDFLCEKQVNKDFDFRSKVINIFDEVEEKKDTSQEKRNKAAGNRKNILLLDEFDTFFSDSFFGKLYYPTVKIKKEQISTLIKLIKNKNYKRLKEVQITPEYKDLFKAVGESKIKMNLIDECIKDLIYDFEQTNNYDYIVKDNKIWYKNQDDYVDTLNYGYQTLKSYFVENERGKISDQMLEQQMGFNVKCGKLSYAEIPKIYQLMIGVSGTVKVMSEEQMRILTDQYKLKKLTFMPSCYGQSNLKFQEEVDIDVFLKEEFLNKIMQQIQIKRTTQPNGIVRPIVVFFETLKKLDEAMKSESMSSIKNFIKQLSEEQSHSQKQTAIKEATRSHYITFSTFAFGRGTDFVVFDKEISSVGGTHVIMTFFPEDLSDIVQIKGRTARQGDQGSFQVILQFEELDKYGINSIEEVVSLKNQGKLYSHIEGKRKEKLSIKSKTKQEILTMSKSQHDEAMEFIIRLKKLDIEYALTYLTKINKGIEIPLQSVQTLIGMDATGSMGGLIEKSKKTIKDMFRKSLKILENNGIDQNCMKIQIVCYRNYSDSEDRLLQKSNWESRVDELEKFLNTIQASGGYGVREAVEMALNHANQQEDLHQVFIIGDAAANTKEEVISKRSNRWEKTKYSTPSFYQDEIKILKDKGIPVHCLWICSSAQSNFEEMAKETGGIVQKLDIYSDQGADQFADIVTKQVLQYIGNSKGLGDKLVKEYERDRLNL